MDVSFAFRVSSIGERPVERRLESRANRTSLGI